MVDVLGRQRRVGRQHDRRPGTAKNVITVGAAENVRPIGFTDGCGVPDPAPTAPATSSTSPAAARPTTAGIKPDVVAPGTHVTGAQPQTGADYNGSGTCKPQFPAAHPLHARLRHVAGRAGGHRVRRAAPRLVPSAPEGDATPSPAMTKAIIVNTATDEAGGNDGAGGTNANVPTQAQGWGRVNLGTLLDGTARAVTSTKPRIRATGRDRAQHYACRTRSEPLRVSLAWTDAPGPTRKCLRQRPRPRRPRRRNVYKGNVSPAASR